MLPSDEAMLTVAIHNLNDNVRDLSGRLDRFDEKVDKKMEEASKKIEDINKNAVPLATCISCKAQWVDKKYVNAVGGAIAALILILTLLMNWHNAVDTVTAKTTIPATMSTATPVR